VVFIRFGSVVGGDFEDEKLPDKPKVKPAVALGAVAAAPPFKNGPAAMQPCREAKRGTNCGAPDIYGAPNSDSA